MKQILATGIEKKRLHPSIQLEGNFNYCEIYSESERLFIRRWGATDDETTVDITPQQKLSVTGYKIDSWNTSTIYIPTENPLLGMGLLPFHPYLFGDNSPCIYSETHLGEPTNPLLNFLFNLTIKEPPKMMVKVKAKKTIEGVVESWDSRYQQDSLGGRQRNSSTIIETPILKKGDVIEISRLKTYGIYFVGMVCPEHKLPYSGADYTPKSEDFEFIYDEELEKYYAKSLACHILKYTQNLISSKGYGVYSASGKSAAVKLPLLIGDVQF